VAYCTHIVQAKLMLKNWRYPQKSYVYSYRKPTDVPLVVQKYSVGIVGQSHATHGHHSNKNILGNCE
jgi:hypothetical protein